MTKEEADIEEHKGNYVTYEEGKMVAVTEE